MTDTFVRTSISHDDRSSEHSRAVGCEVLDRVELRACDDVEFWRWAVRNLPGGTPFIEWEFLDLQEHVFGIEIERFVVVAGGERVGVIPIARSIRPALQSPWVGFPYLGPAVQPKALTAVLRAVRRYQWRTGLLLTHFDLAPALTALSAAAVRRAPMHEHPDGTVQIDLSHRSEAEIDTRMGKSRRRLIRKAIDSGVEARAARPGEIATMLGTALQAAYAHRGARNPYPADIGAQVEQWALTQPEVLLSVAVLGETVLSADVTLAQHSTAVAWLGARSARGQSGDADAVLTRHVLLQLLRSGHDALDLGGRVDDAVERYKLSFGGHVVSYSTVESVLGPIAAVDLARKAVHRARSSRRSVLSGDGS